MRAFAPLAVAGLLCTPCLAWDDEDDGFGKANSTRRTSVIDYGYGSTKADNSSFRANRETRSNLDSFSETERKRERQREDFAERNRQMNEEQDRQWAKLKEKEQARNDEWETRRWRNVETVAGAFVATGPYYKGGNAVVQTDKGLVYAVGNDGVVGPDGYYFRSGNFWVGPNGKGGSVSGSGNNEFIAGGAQGAAIGLDRGFSTSRGYSYPAYPDQTYQGVSRTMRRP